LFTLEVYMYIINQKNSSRHMTHYSAFLPLDPSPSPSICTLPLRRNDIGLPIRTLAPPTPPSAPRTPGGKPSVGMLASGTGSRAEPGPTDDDGVLGTIWLFSSASR